MRIAIIGAGIIGLYLSWKLTQKGEKVLVFEKNKEIGKKTCSGLFSERILEFIPESRNLIKNEINFCLINFPKKRIKIEFSKKFLVIDRSQLDNLVAELARKAGAKIFLNYEISSFPKGFDKIIGCDGAFSQVRKKLKLKDPQFYLGIQGFTLSSKENLNQKINFVETWPTKSGFLWKIPRGNEIEYGIFEKPKEAEKIFENFLESKKIHLEKINSAIIPQGLVIPRNSKVTLCGDAMGLTKPWSGGGVIWGLIGANFLLETFPDFRKYEKIVKKFFQTQIFFSKIIKKMIYFLGKNLPSILPKNYKIEGDFLV
jgi:flavin-dependent dehydrogenase